MNRITAVSCRRPASLLVSLVVVLTASLSVAAPASAAQPANDDRADAQVLPGPRGSVNGNNVGATSEQDETLTSSVWFSWTATADGVERFRSETSHGTIAVYAAGSSQPLQGADSSCSGEVYFGPTCYYVDATAGTTYHVALGTDPFYGPDQPGAGPYTLTWKNITAPDNDDFADAAVVTRDPRSAETHLAFPDVLDVREAPLATLEDGEQPTAFASGPSTHTIWYAWTPAHDGEATFAVAVGPPPHLECFYRDAVAQVYTGTSISDRRLVGSDFAYPESGADACTVPVVRVPVTSGTTYHIMVDSPAGPAPIRGSIALAPSCDITGTQGDDSVVGTPGDDVLCGLGGDDVLEGMGGDDILIGGEGVDTVSYAGSEAAVDADLRGGTARGQGADTLDGIESVVGSAFDDTLAGSRVTGPSTLLSGGGGDDKLIGDGNDKLVGGDGDDTLIGSYFEDKLFGGPGDDRLIAGLRNVRILGGSGNDTIRSADAGLTNGGFATLSGGSGNDRIISGANNDTTAVGGAGADTIRGSYGKDRLTGGPGKDRIFGLFGRDTLVGGTGRDLCNGGGGRDTATTCEILRRVP